MHLGVGRIFKRLAVTFLEKDEDYGDPSIARSIYALNFPEHRATLGLIWNPISAIEVLAWIMNGGSKEKLRTGTKDLMVAPKSYGRQLLSAQIEDLELFIAYDKPWDEDFQDIPGTPGRGDPSFRLAEPTVSKNIFWANLWAT